MTQFNRDSNNIEFNELIERLSTLGVSLDEIAEKLSVSRLQIESMSSGDRRASNRDVNALRKLARKQSDAKNSEPVLKARSTSDSAFGMPHATLRALSTTDATQAFRDLLWARATSLRVPITQVSISSNVNVADGGIDASILEGHWEPVQDELLTSGTRFQIKTGDFAAWQTSKMNAELFESKAREFASLGSEVQDALRKNHRIVYVNFGTDPIDRDIRKAQKNFKDAFQACGYPDVEVEVWGQTQLIGLFQSYPSLCLRLRGHMHQGFRSHHSWSEDSDMAPTVHYNSDQKALIEELRTELRSGKTPHIRLIGEPGLGKTRFALELTRHESLSSLTLYVSEGRGLFQSSFLTELIQSEDNRFVIVVIDECSQQDLAAIWNLLKPKSSRLRVISIDHGPDKSIDDKTRRVCIEPAGHEQIIAILRDYEINVYDADRWSAYCEGSPLVAHVIGTNLSSNSSDILASPSITKVWNRYVDGYDSAISETAELRRIVLCHLALFERFGFETPVADETDFIQSLAQQCDARITGPRIRAIISGLKDRGILHGNTTLYLTPKLLHVYLCREFWNLYGSGFNLTAMLKKLPQTMWRWFIEMLPYTHGIPSAEKAIDQLLGFRGAFQTDEFPDSERDGRLVFALAETCPKQTLRCLKRTIGSMNESSLRGLRKSRQFLVWALEKIAVWDEYFVDATYLLLNLAEAENSNNSNNATGTFRHLFSLVPGLAPTQASPKVRLRALALALESDSLPRREIALEACLAALSRSRALRMIGPEYQGVRPTIKFWGPVNSGELAAARQDVWYLLIDRLAIWQGPARTKLISTVIQAAWSTLHIPELTEATLKTLRQLASDSDTNIKELVTFARRQARHKEGRISETVREELKEICTILDGYDFQSKLLRIVKFISGEDHHDDDWNQTDFVERKLDELAEIVREDPKVLIPELPWLVCEGSSSSYCFAYRISVQDVQRSFLPQILEQQIKMKELAKTEFLSGYLAGIFRHNNAEWESVMGTLSMSPGVIDRFSDFVLHSGLTNTVVMQVIKQCRLGLQSKSLLESWWFRPELQSLDPDVITEMIGLLIEDGTSPCWHNAVRTWHSYYLGNDSVNRPFPEAVSFRLLTAPGMGIRGIAQDEVDYYWSRLFDSFLEQFPHRTWELFEAVLHTGSREWSVLGNLDAYGDHVLTSLVKTAPVDAWCCIERVLADDEADGFSGLWHWLTKDNDHAYEEAVPGAIQYIPSQLLCDWAAKDLETRGAWLSLVLPKTLDQSIGGRLTRDFIARFGKTQRIASSLWSHFGSRAWCGNESDNCLRLRGEANSWLIDETDLVVIGWVEGYIERLDCDIKGAVIDEERRD